MNPLDRSDDTANSHQTSQLCGPPLGPSPEISPSGARHDAERPVDAEFSATACGRQPLNYNNIDPAGRHTDRPADGRRTPSVARAAREMPLQPVDAALITKALRPEIPRMVVSTPGTTVRERAGPHRLYTQGQQYRFAKQVRIRAAVHRLELFDPVDGAFDGVGGDILQRRRSRGEPRFGSMRSSRCHRPHRPQAITTSGQPLGGLNSQRWPGRGLLVDGGAEPVCHPPGRVHGPVNRDGVDVCC